MELNVIQMPEYTHIESDTCITSVLIWDQQ